MTNVEGRYVYEDDWKELDDIEIKNHWIDHSVYLLLRLDNENVFP